MSQKSFYLPYALANFAAILGRDIVEREREESFHARGMNSEKKVVFCLPGWRGFGARCCVVTEVGRCKVVVFHFTIQRSVVETTKIWLQSGDRAINIDSLLRNDGLREAGDPSIVIKQSIIQVGMVPQIRRLAESCHQPRSPTGTRVMGHPMVT